MQPAPWLPHEPMRSRQAPLPRYSIIAFPYTRPQTDDCRLCLFAPFPLFGRGFASQVQATVESRCFIEGCERLARDDVL